MCHQPGAMITLLILHLMGVAAMTQGSVPESRVENLDYEDLPSTIRSGTVVVAYFYKTGAEEAAVGLSLLEELDAYFARYPSINIRLCKVACPDASGQFCRGDLVNAVVHVFRRGQPRVSLALTAVSPLDATVATALHLWLADSVTVVFTAKELIELEHKCHGRCNILLAYFPSLGAAEHRLLLEAAMDHTIATENDIVTSQGRTDANQGDATTSHGDATTSQGDATTNQGGATTSQGGATTSQGGATTSQGGATTSQGGAITSQGGATTSQGGATTNQGGATTSQGGATTSQGGATTSQGGATTSQGGATTSQGGATTSQGGATTSQGGGITSQGGATTSQGGATTSQGGATTSQGGATTSQRGATTSQGGAATTQGSSIASQEGATTTQGSSIASQEGATTTQGSSIVSEEGTATDQHGRQLRFVLTSSAEVVADLPIPIYQAVEDQLEVADSRLWMLLCRDTIQSGDRCWRATFHDEMDETTLGPFLAAQNRPGWVLAPPRPAPIPLPFDLSEQHVVLMVADDQSLSRVTAIAPALGNLFRGTFGFVVINLDTQPHSSLLQFGLKREQLHLPALAFISKGTTAASTVLSRYDDVIGFLHDQLMGYWKAEDLRRRDEIAWDDLELEMDSVPDVLKQDDEVELSLPEEDDFSSIRNLSEDEFCQEEKSGKFLAVVGYLPWDPPSRALLWQLQTLPDHVTKHLAMLNCLDWSHLCDRLGVRSHPQVVTISARHSRLYTGAPTRHDLLEHVIIGASSIPLALDGEQLDRWLAGQLTESPLDGTDRIMLLPVSATLRTAAIGRLRGVILVGSFADQYFSARFGTANAVCLKRKDPFQPMLDIDLQELDESGRLCVLALPQLSEETFHLLVPSMWTFLLFCTPPSCPGAAEVDSLTASAGMEAPLINNFYWMNSSETMVQHVREQYDIVSGSALVAVDLTSGHVARYQGPPERQQLRQWVSSVLDGQVHGKVMLRSEPWLPVLPPIEFSWLSERQEEEIASQDMQHDNQLLNAFQAAAGGRSTHHDEL